MQAEQVCIFLFIQETVLPFLNGKGIGFPLFVSRRPCGLGWLKENHPRYAPVFSFAKP
jgi:hypothetical protein